MADSKITALTALTAADPVNDMFPIVDVSDTSMAASGTTKRISANNILSSSPTASGALTVTGLVTAGSATITGALGAAGLNVTGATIPANGVYLGSANNLSFSAASTLAMTLNSTGLGIGASPAYKLHVAGSNPTAAINSTLASISSIATLLYRNVDGNSISRDVASIAGETAGNGGYGNLIFSTGFNGSLVERMRIDLSGNLILQSSATPATLGTNGMLTVNATSNTNLRFSYRGSDGTTRVANITLA